MNWSEGLEGLELDSKYRLVRKIGEGGMGSVFEADDLSLERSVAVKLYPSKDSDSELRTRFFKEIKTAAKLEHKNLVPVYDGSVDQGFLFFVMRLVPGVDLKKILEDGPLEPERALTFLGEIASALDAMHSAQYVHRDIKPANILIADPGKQGEYPLLGDLGIARALEAPDGITQGQPPGTPTYTAPETVQQWEANALSDQYALGCVLFEMLAGRPPFSAEEVSEIRRLHVEEPAPDIAEFLPGVTEAVREALKKALSKDPADRYANVVEFAEAAQADSDAPQSDNRPQRRLTPVEISKALFGVSPDRDERASQVAMETFLTLWANNYKPPEGPPASPKRRNGALRSLALEENFLEGFDQEAGGGMTVEQMGARLAKGQDFAGSSELSLAQDALHALVDERTLQGASGATLLLPFSEPLLWFDARRSGSAKPWAVRKVNMRGTGVTLGRMLLDPPEVDGADDLPAQAAAAVDGIRSALQAPTPFSELAERLQEAAPDELEKRTPERDETDAWNAAESPLARPLAARLVSHCTNITRQEGVPASAQLLQIRAILALDLAHHALVRSWEEVDTPKEYRFLLLSFTSDERRKNRVRVASEDAYQSARQQIVQGIIQTLARQAEGLAAGDGEVDWDAQFESRSHLEEIAARFGGCSDPDAFLHLAGLVFEQSSGGGYNRPVDAYRVLLESIGLLAGSGQYRYLRAQPELLGAFIGAVGGGPMTAEEFLRRLSEEWDIVVGEREMAGTVLVDSLDGNLLARNSRSLEHLLVSSGLGLALSDQTCMVGPALRAFK